MSLEARRAKVINDNLQKSFSNYTELTLPKYNQEQLDEIKKAGEYEVITQESFNKYTADTNDKLNKGYLTAEERQNYIDDSKQLEKAIRLDENGNEEPIFFYSLVEKVEELKKSESGEEEKIEKSVYKDNPLNRKFERVGKPLETEQGS